jgi:8-oxo-dGTP diphosphatase
VSGPASTPVVAVGAIVLDGDGRVLVVQRGRPPGRGQWSVPGGRVELGEALTAAVAREVREETGLTVDVGPLVEVVERMTPGDGGVYHYVILDYLARGAGSPVAGDDALAARWVTDDELAALEVTDGLREVVERARTFAIANPAPTR